MKIRNITVRNFRGFEHKSFSFDPRMNVVLGDNTTGKTTLLHAVQIALGAYLQSLTLVKGVSRNFKKEDHVSKYSESSKSFLPIIEKPSIEVNADFIIGDYHTETHLLQTSTQTIRWKRESNKNSRSAAGELMDAVENMEKKRRTADHTGLNSVFPLFLSFGASRLEKNYNAAQKTKARASREAKAYRCALDEQVDFKSAFDWIYRYDKELAKGLEFEGTKEAFVYAIQTAIPALKQIDIDIKNNEFTALVQMSKDPVPYWLTYDMMSAGFKAMINIAAEIAYRCVELNGFLGVNAVEQTPGIVLIDEVDLYLHPHWQQHVLADLQEAFPLFQFIVTTHSPFIVQSVDTNNVITLDATLSPISPSNRGIEEIMVTEMGLDVDLGNRSEKYRKKYDLAHKYYQLVKEGREGTKETEAVKEALDRLEAEARMYHDPAFEAELRLKRGDV